ncbi:unnamed protein product [Umbelopsis vinacea]
MSNGYEHRPQPIARRSDPFNFATAVAKSSRFSGVNTTPQPVEQADAAVAADHQAPLPLSRNTSARQDWDCYPMVLRNVQNYGSQDMRDRLHAMEHSTMNSMY